MHLCKNISEYMFYRSRFHYISYRVTREFNDSIIYNIYCSIKRTIKTSKKTIMKISQGKGKITEYAYIELE